MVARLGEKALFVAFALVFLAGAGWWSAEWYMRHTTVVPVRGGELREAIVGSPLYINPVLPDTSAAESALEALIFSSLLRADLTGGFAADLAEDYTISEDRQEYFVTLRPDVKWQDGAPLTVDDVLFTISLIQNPLLRSPLAAAWQGVEAEKISDRTVKFTLEKPYEYFLQNLTFRILPQHLWAQVPIESFHLADLNRRPIGSGSYRFKSFERDQAGNITSFTLSANPLFYRQVPYIGTIRFRFFNTQDEALLAWKKNEVDAFGGLDALDARGVDQTSVLAIPSSRLYAVFFNTDAPILSNASIRAALAESVDRTAFVADVLKNFARVAEGPVPGDIATSTPPDLDDAIARVEKAGWKDFKKPFSLELIVPERAQHLTTAEFLKESWRKIGLDLRISVMDQAALSNALRSRNYDMILFGTLFGPDPDLFPFWHSSQVDYPGFNLSRLESKNLDTLLDRLRRTDASDGRQTLLADAEALILSQNPAVFLYSPSYLYGIPPWLTFGTMPTLIGAPEERFNRVEEWYAITKRVWKR